MSKPAGIVTAIILMGLNAAPALAQQTDALADASVMQILPAALILCWPLGFILLISSATPESTAPATALQLLMTWGVAVLAYFAVGFAFQFGGIAQVTPEPSLSGLYWEWYPLGPSVDLEVARLWGVIALQGWGLTGAAATTGAFQLFAHHVALVGLTAMLPAAVLLQQKREGIALLIGLISGAILYPVGGNWVWGGGWLSQLGISLGLGHGFVDFGGVGIIFLTGSLVALVTLLLFKPSPVEDTPPEPEEVVVSIAADNSLTVYEKSEAPLTKETFTTAPMPSAYLPILSVLGVDLMLIGWFGVAENLHNPTAVNASPTHAAVSGLLAALSAGLAAAGYSYLTTRKLDLLMTSRGLSAGLVIAIAGAPFIPPWILVISGLVMGLLLPLLIYLLNQKLHLADELAIVTTYGVSTLVSLLLVSFFADGQAGQGWNGVGALTYNGVPGQGVSGLIVAAGYNPDWPGQFQAQLMGIGAIAVLALGVSFLVLQTVKVIRNAWARSGLELAKPAVSPPGWMKRAATKSTTSPSETDSGEKMDT